MNTLARTVDLQSFEIKVKPFVVSNLFTGILVFIVLATALSVVYVKDLNRRLFIQYQTLQQEKNQMGIDWGRLLLEQSTWSVQSRIQQIAQQDLQMHAPLSSEVVLISEKSIPNIAANT